MAGWVCLHRSIVKWEWYDDINVSRLFIHCLIRANHSDSKWRGQDIKRGQFITSLDTLSKETGLSVSQIRTAFRKLESTGEIASLSQARSRVVTVLKYDSYQDNDKLPASIIAPSSQARDKLVTTDNNDNNKNNDNSGHQVDLEEAIQSQNKTTPSKVKNLFNEILGDKLPSIRSMTGNRIKHMNARINEYRGDKDFHEICEWERFFTYVRTSCPFLIGETPRQLSGEQTFLPDFDWLMKPDNFAKCVEGKYESR